MSYYLIYMSMFTAIKTGKLLALYAKGKAPEKIILNKNR